MQNNAGIFDFSQLAPRIGPNQAVTFSFSTYSKFSGLLASPSISISTRSCHASEFQDSNPAICRPCAVS